MKNKILIIGLPFFAKKLAQNLQLKFPQNTYIALDTNKYIKSKILYAFHILNADTIYQIGGNTYTGGALGLAYLLKKRIVLHWVGTDVLMALKFKGSAKFNPTFLKHAEHLCEVDWIADELREVEIFPQKMQIACLDPIDQKFNSMPNTFSILTYMTPGREKFYGLDKIIQLAKKFPNVIINIVGISAYEAPLPENIRLLGWIKNISDIYLKTSVYLRLPEHDGLSVSVLEALSMFRHVGYSQKLSGTHYIDSYSTLEDYISSLHNQHVLGQLKPNEEGIKFIVENFQKDNVLQSLNKYLTSK